VAADGIPKLHLTPLLRPEQGTLDLHRFCVLLERLALTAFPHLPPADAINHLLFEHVYPNCCGGEGRDHPMRGDTGVEAAAAPARCVLGDTSISLGDAKSSLGDTKSSLGDAKSSLGDAKSSLGDTKCRGRWWIRPRRRRGAVVRASVLRPADAQQHSPRRCVSGAAMNGLEVESVRAGRWARRRDEGTRGEGDARTGASESKSSRWLSTSTHHLDCHGPVGASVAATPRRSRRWRVSATPLHYTGSYARVVEGSQQRGYRD
jgi:hypothetical protein